LATSKVDGVMDEPVWKEAEVATNFFMVRCRWIPVMQRCITEVRMTYDDHNLYLIAVCFQALPGPYFDL